MAATESLFAALADPTRRGVLELIAAAPRRVGDIAAALPVSRSAVSQHLAVLREAGLVRRERSGRVAIYHVEAAALDALAAYVDGLRGGARAAVEEPVDIAADLREWQALWPGIDPASGVLVSWMRSVTEILEALLARAAAAHGMGVIDVSILGVLHRIGAPHASTPTNLSKVSRRSLPGMTRQLGVLERLGYIGRDAAENDGRSRVVRLTASGARALHASVTEHFAGLAEAFAGLTVAERLQLARLVRKLLLSLRRSV